MSFVPSQCSRKINFNTQCTPGPRSSELWHQMGTFRPSSYVLPTTALTGTMEQNSSSNHICIFIHPYDFTKYFLNFHPCFTEHIIQKILVKFNGHENSKSASKGLWFHYSPTVVYQLCTLSCDLFALSIIDLMNCFRRRLTSRKYTKYESR